jgi:hypothetical protein
MHSIKFGGGGFHSSSRNFLVIYILRYAYSTQWLDSAVFNFLSCCDRISYFGIGGFQEERT